MINKNIFSRVKTSLFLLGILLLMIKYKFVSMYIIIIFAVLSIIEFLEIVKKIFERKIFILLANLFFITYITLFCLFFSFFSNFIQLKIILYLLIISCISSDLGGFLFGKIFKGPKLTNISPNKTYSGALGSILLSCIVTTTLFFLLTNNFSLFIIILSILTSISCQIGDLFFSYLKRKAKIKDTGNILPGHGGILDRIDGILFGVPLGYFSFILIN